MTPDVSAPTLEGLVRTHSHGIQPPLYFIVVLSGSQAGSYAVDTTIIDMNKLARLLREAFGPGVTIEFTADYISITMVPAGAQERLLEIMQHNFEQAGSHRISWHL